MPNLVSARRGDQDRAKPSCRCYVTPTLPTNFGEAVYLYRTQRRQSQAALSRAAKMSAGYLSELETGKRLAPARATALRIAAALELGDEDQAQLVQMAEVERASLTTDASFEPHVREVLAEIRSTAAKLSPRATERLRAFVKELAA